MERKVKPLKTQLSSYVFYILSVWFVSILVIYTNEAYTISASTRAYNKANAQVFTDYMIYHRLQPSKKEVGYGDAAFFKSDSEVIKAGFSIEWRENIECDNNPNDDFDYYEFYAQAATTERRKEKKEPRLLPETYRTMKGFPATSSVTGEPIRYPNHDANCRLNSDMRITIEFGIVLHFHMVSEDVHVRKLDQ